MLWIVCMMDNEYDDEYSHEVYFDDAEDALLFTHDLLYAESEWKKYDMPDYIELVGMYQNDLIPYLNHENETNEKMYGQWMDVKELHRKRQSWTKGQVPADILERGSITLCGV